MMAAWIVRRPDRLATAACLALAMGALASADEPRLPGAMNDPPEWLVKDAPFDMKAFFALPKPEENAAPLYLDALLEFGPELASCFPTDVRARADAARERAKRMMAVWEPWSNDPASVDRAKLDDVIRDHAEGLRKLELAQQRPLCVFVTGITFESLLPHAQVARSVARVLALRADRDIDLGDFDGAIGCVETTLRLSRDLRPRGGLIIQLVSIAIDATITLKVVPLVLAHPRLRPEHCDRLIAAIERHQAAATDAYTTAVKAEYALTREVVRRFQDRIRLQAGPDGLPFDKPIGYGEAYSGLMDGFEGKPNKPISDFNGLVMSTLYGMGTPRDRAAFAEIARELLAAAPKPERARRRAFDAIEAKYLKPGSPDASALVRLLTSAYQAFVTADAREGCYLGSAKALLALRRWGLTHREPPPSLEAACLDTKMPSVPIDPFSGAALKLATVDDVMIVYSIGPDGRDDHALKDSDLARKSQGDILFAMPKVAGHAR